jgi:hypothetical protein
MLKLKPFEQYVGDDLVRLYVGIRADEPNRTGYISTKSNIKTTFPFIEDNLRYKDIMRILRDSGLGLPKYYNWRSRSGCYFCFFQQRREWIGLLENHKTLFEKASAFEKTDPETGDSFTWIQGESLQQLADPQRSAEIKKDYQERMARMKQNRVNSNTSLIDVLTDEDNSSGGCLICHL